MNKIFKVVWSKVRNCYVVVSEIAKNTVSGVGKRNRVKRFSMGATLAAVALTSSFFMPNGVWAAVDINQVIVPNTKDSYVALAVSDDEYDSTNANNPSNWDKPSSPFGGNVLGNQSDGYYVINDEVRYNFLIVKVGENKYKHYWVVDGFGVKAITNRYHPQASTATVDLYTLPGGNANYDKIVLAGEHTAELTDVRTAINNKRLEVLGYYQYGAITNSGTTDVTTGNQFFY